MVRLRAVRAAKVALLLITIVGGMGYVWNEGHQTKEARQQPSATCHDTRTIGSVWPCQFDWSGKTFQELLGRGGADQSNKPNLYRYIGETDCSVREEIKGSLCIRNSCRDFDHPDFPRDHSINNVFVVTAYTNGYESTQKKLGQKGYGTTATGTHTKAGRTIAADWAVLPPGTKVSIEGLEGVYIVEDKGSAVKGMHIDLYIPRLKDAKTWGKQERSITIIEWGRLP